MIIEYNSKKLDEIVRQFYLSTNVNISILDSYYTPIVQKGAQIPYCRIVQSNKSGRLGCLSSTRALLDRASKSMSTELRLCHAGLVEIVVPLLSQGEIIGYVLLGYIRPDEQIYTDDPVKIPEWGDAYEEYNKMKKISSLRISALVGLATTLARYIVLDNLISQKYDSNLEAVNNYVKANLSKALTIPDICKNANISRATLYEVIRKNYGCTVKDYVNSLRLVKVKELLHNTDLSIQEISDMFGLSGAPYLGKLFKKKYGISPLKYRKNCNKNDGV